MIPNKIKILLEWYLKNNFQTNRQQDAALRRPDAPARRQQDPKGNGIRVGREQPQHALPPHRLRLRAVACRVQGLHHAQRQHSELRSVASRQLSEPGNSLGSLERQLPVCSHPVSTVV